MWTWEAVVCLGSVGLTQGSYRLGCARDPELYPKKLLNNSKVYNKVYITIFSVETKSKMLIDVRVNCPQLKFCWNKLSHMAFSSFSHSPNQQAGWEQPLKRTWQSFVSLLMQLQPAQCQAWCGVAQVIVVVKQESNIFL